MYMMLIGYNINTRVGVLVDIIQQGKYTHNTTILNWIEIFHVKVYVHVILEVTNTWDNHSV